MGNAEVVQQEKDKTPSWAWKGVPKDHAQVPRSNSPIASLAARLAAIRVGPGTLSSSKATEAETDLLEAERVCDDNKENLDTLGTWSYREPGFEQRLKSAAKSRAEMASATVQSVQGLEQELKNMRFRSSPKRASLDAAPAATAADCAHMASSRERPNVAESIGLHQQATSTSSRVHSETRSPDSSTVRTEADVTGHWTRMWTQLSGTEDTCADANCGQERRCQDDVRGGNLCGDSNWVHDSAPSDAGKIATPSDGTSVGAGSQQASQQRNMSAYGAEIANLPDQVDATSYLLGERAALERAFRQVMPQRDQVTTLHGAVAQLRSLSQQESVRLRRLENAGSVLHSAIFSANERLQKVEQTVPALETSLAELRGHLAGMAYMTSELTAVRASLAALEANQDHINERLSYTSSTFFKFLTGSWGRLLGYLARADVVALYLARRILLDAAEPAEPSLPRTPLSPADVEAGLPSPGKFEWSADHVHSLARAVSRHRKVRSAAGAVLVVAAVEATWRLQRAARRPLPKFLHSMTVPLDTCLRLARVCVWASAFVVGAEELKKGCYSAAESVAKIQDTVSEGIKTRSTLIADGLAVRQAQLRCTWGLLSSRLLQCRESLGFEGPVEKGADGGGDVDEIGGSEASCRALSFVSEQSFRTSS